MAFRWALFQLHPFFSTENTVIIDESTSLFIPCYPLGLYTEECSLATLLWFTTPLERWKFMFFYARGRFMYLVLWGRIPIPLVSFFPFSSRKPCAARAHPSPSHPSNEDLKQTVKPSLKPIQPRNGFIGIWTPDAHPW